MILSAAAFRSGIAPELYLGRNAVPLVSKLGIRARSCNTVSIYSIPPHSACLAMARVFSLCGERRDDFPRNNGLVQISETPDSSMVLANSLTLETGRSGERHIRV